MTFSILDHLEKLEPAKEKGKYICPVCEGNDLAVSPKTGAYSCFSGGCDTADIRNAIAPLPNGHQPQGHGSRKPKGRRLSEREKDRAAQQKASAVETKVDELLLSVAGGWHTKEEALIELGQWAKLEDFDAWDAKQLFKVRAKDNRIGEKVAEQPGIEVGSVSIEAHMLDGHFGGGAGDVITIDDTYYRYSNGHWQPCSDKQVMAEIALALKTRYKWSEGRDPKQLFTYATNSNKSAVYSYCRDALHKEIDPSSNRHLRAFLNGTVDMRRGTIHPHRRDDYLTRAIAANYAPGADCPEVFRQFVESSFGPEMLRFIRALVSMYIDPTAPYGYAAHFIGPSGSGKGTMIRLLKSLFSETSAKSLGSFDDIATPEDRHQYLTGAELVAFPDLAGYQRGKGLQAFYELVDNGGMAGRALFSSSSYDKRWYCRFVLGSVTHLAVDNASD